ncbi:maleylpyruvate isomerase family mycothiol-dependent enzyme [Streptomyces bambusae]|uniref:maleylpyruvate isomerase family mycothiol-dependent enzyme n=1 Tax=Streptomyces bambusae TaxID=1550616 RepID=UPI001CFC5B84|nr:maleylpyruvate isomerase family mycothiol-dependent enzyme [Streptomyces bambusae]MCB5163413.1 maleylpyruvate isomerase family mycothiol-dependent enzyme [Streptomyces bambusae]
MTVHPAIQPYVDAWNHAIEAISELIAPLPDADWNRATPCPGWSVRDVVSHVIGLETEQLGDPRPIHSLPRDLRHVVDEASRYMEVQVDARRHHTSLEITSELEYTVIRRARQLRNDKRDPETATGRGPFGEAIPLPRALQLRAFDVWIHEQDLRTALGVPGNLDSPGAHIACEIMLGALPRVVAKNAGAPAGTAVVIDVHGPLEFMRTVRVDADGKGSIDGTPSLGPAVTLATDWETYFRLAAGRLRPQAAGDRLKVDGDQDLADAILREFAITP